LARVLALIAGTLKHFPNGSFTLGNSAYTTATLVQALQSLADAINALNAVQASAKDAKAALRALQVKVMPLIGLYRRFLLAMFAGASQELADFGMTPAKAHQPRSSGQKAAAAAKLRATRKARGTTSKKQKAGVHGDVTGVVITPVTSTPAASPSAEAAPNASNASPAPTAPSGGGSNAAPKQ
jgi:hypothetical protein